MKTHRKAVQLRTQGDPSEDRGRARKSNQPPLPLTESASNSVDGLVFAHVLIEWAKRAWLYNVVKTRTFSAK